MQSIGKTPSPKASAPAPVSKTKNPPPPSAGSRPDGVQLSAEARQPEAIGTMPNLGDTFGKDPFAHERDLVQRGLQGRPPVDGEIRKRDEVEVMNEIIRSEAGTDQASQQRNTRSDAELARAQGVPFWDESRVQNLMMRAPAGVEARDQKLSTDLQALQEQITSPVAPLL